VRGEEHFGTLGKRAQSAVLCCSPFMLCRRAGLSDSQWNNFRLSALSSGIRCKVDSDLHPISPKHPKGAQSGSNENSQVTQLVRSQLQRITICRLLRNPIPWTALNEAVLGLHYTRLGQDGLTSVTLRKSRRAAQHHWARTEEGDFKLIGCRVSVPVCGASRNS
jgi:hypothetical protein